MGTKKSSRKEKLREIFFVFKRLNFFEKPFGSFPFVPRSSVGAHYLHPPDARAIFSYAGNPL